MRDAAVRAIAGVDEDDDDVVGADGESRKGTASKAEYMVLLSEGGGGGEL